MPIATAQEATQVFEKYGWLGFSCVAGSEAELRSCRKENLLHRITITVTRAQAPRRSAALPKLNLLVMGTPNKIAMVSFSPLPSNAVCCSPDKFVALLPLSLLQRTVLTICGIACSDALDKGAQRLAEEPADEHHR